MGGKMNFGEVGGMVGENGNRIGTPVERDKPNQDLMFLNSN